MVYLTDPQTNTELTKLFKPKALNKNKMGKIKGLNEEAHQRMQESKKMAEEEENKEEETKEEEAEKTEEKTDDTTDDTSEKPAETSEETSEDKPAE